MVPNSVTPTESGRPKVFIIKDLKVTADPRNISATPARNTFSFLASFTLRGKKTEWTETGKMEFTDVSFDPNKEELEFSLLFQSFWRGFGFMDANHGSTTLRLNLIVNRTGIIVSSVEPSVEGKVIHSTFVGPPGPEYEEKINAIKPAGDLLLSNSPVPADVEVRRAHFQWQFINAIHPHAPETVDSPPWMVNAFRPPAWTIGMKVENCVQRYLGWLLR